MSKFILILITVHMLFTWTCCAEQINKENIEKSRPNIIFILADDLGYGDLSCTGGKAPTPFLDSIAKNGVLFNDAHTTSSVCSPSRYSLMTGRYNWRRLSHGIVWDFAPSLLRNDRITIADYLRTKGYQTHMVGKWHLGHTWKKLPKGQQRMPNNVPEDKYTKSGWQFDYTQKALGGPSDHGFDSFYGISASLDVPPFVYIENGFAEKVPTEQKTIVPRTGPAAEGFDEYKTLDIFADKSRKVINKACKEDQPFFLFLSLTSPHNPISPSKRWWGKSKFGRIGDFIMQTDWIVGEVIKQLKTENQLNNTLIMFSSDNGSPFWKNGQSKAVGHHANGRWRGGKSSVYEGGHRVPFLVQWPNKVKGGRVSNSLITLADFFATAADAIGEQSGLKDHVAEDSFSFLPDLIESGTTKRKNAILHSLDGTFGIRQGRWKLIFSPDSGGWDEPKPKPEADRWTGDNLFQLYDLESDPQEKKNVWQQHPEIVRMLSKAIFRIADNGRSTQGKKQENDVSHPNGKYIKNVHFPAVYSPWISE
jgi:arylsulfatase A-like enzyme